MGKRIGQQPHPKCGSSDALQIYEQDDGTINGFCYSCSSYVSPEELEGGATQREEKPLAPMINNRYPAYIDQLVTRASPTRGLLQETLEAFGVKTELSQADGVTVVAHYYPVTKDGGLTGWKCRKMPKEFVGYGDVKNPELFGQWKCKDASTKRLYITEGEEDAMALYQAIRQHQRGTAYEQFKPAVVSLPNGTSSAVRSISDSRSFVNRYEQVVLVFDQDDAGRKASQEVLKLLPTALIAELPLKDANEMVMKGQGNALAKAVLFNARTHRPACVVGVEDVYERAIALPVKGLDWPWPSLTSATYGIHTKKIIGLAAGVGIGKSLFMKELIAKLIKDHTQKVGAILLEEDASNSLKEVAGRIRGKLFHKPDGTVNIDELKDAVTELQNKIYFLSHVGTKDWDEVKSAIRYMVVVEGCKYIVLDPLTALVAHLSSAEANDGLNKIMSEMASIVHELDCSIFYAAHLNPPKGGGAYERGARPLESDLTGSRGMIKWSNLILGLSRNKDPTIPEDERNTTVLEVLKDREYGSSISFPIYYNKITGEFKEPKGLGF